MEKAKGGEDDLRSAVRDVSSERDNETGYRCAPHTIVHGCHGYGDKEGYRFRSYELDEPVR